MAGSPKARQSWCPRPPCCWQHRLSAGQGKRCSRHRHCRWREKCRFLKEEIGCDDAVDYKSGNLNEKLKAACPDGINVFFDNVGGDVLDAALDNIAKEARVVICGAISQYNHMTQVKGPKLYLRIPERNASMLGFSLITMPNSSPRWRKISQVGFEMVTSRSTSTLNRVSKTFPRR